MPPKKKKETPPSLTPVESSNTGIVVLITMIVTAIIVVVVMYNWQTNVVKDTKVSSLSNCVGVADANTELQKQFTTLEEKVTSLEEEKIELKELMQVRMNPKEGWEIYIPEQPKNPEEKVNSELIGKNVEEAREILGEPPILLRNGSSNQIWVYYTSTENNVGLYVTFIDEKISDVKLDGFNGVDNLPSLLD